jgi:hypothetical protein
MQVVESWMQRPEDLMIHLQTRLVQLRSLETLGDLLLFFENTHRGQLPVAASPAAPQFPLTILCGVNPAIQLRLPRTMTSMAMEGYLKALLAHDSSTLPLSPTLKATENAEPSDLKSGLWTQASKIGSYAFTVTDRLTNQHGFVGLIWRGDKDASLVSIRIKVNQQGQIEESEIIVGLDRFPGTTGTDPKTLTTWRPDFGTVVPVEKRLSREKLQAIAASYYDGVNNCTPEKVPLSHTGNRVENGTRITNTSTFSFADGMYESLDPNVTIPNFAEWSAKEQFDRGLWNADTVAGARFPLIDVEHGLVMAYALYQSWTKSDVLDVKGVGKVRRLGVKDRMGVSLCMMELFKIRDEEIHDMESVWFVGPYPMESGW